MKRNSKMKTTSKIKTTSKTKTTEDDLKNWPSPKLFPPPPPLKKLPEICLMTSHLDCHTTTDIKPDMLSVVKPRGGGPQYCCRDCKTLT